MATQTAGHEPNPLLIYNALNGFQRSTALKAAIELEVFTLIGAGVTSAADLARRAETSEKGMRILCDFMAIEGFLTKQNGIYALTADSAVFLDQKSPAYLGSIAEFLLHPTHIANYLDMTAAVRKGGVVHGQGNMDPEAPVWVEFAKSMAPLSAMGAAAMAQIVNVAGQPLKVLDIAAGPGLYGIEIAKLNPKAEIYALDWRNVLELSAEHARQAGVEKRYHTIPGSAFDVDLGSGYDLILLPNFLHHFDHATNVKLLKRVRAALQPSGRLVTVEFVPNDDRISPPAAAAFSLMMLGSTESGDAYTLKELDRMFRDAGFGSSDAQPLGPQTLIITKY